MRAPTVAESLHSQLHAPELVVCGGPCGCRVAFVGGPVFEVVADELTSGEAYKLLQAARLALWSPRKTNGATA